MKKKWFIVFMMVGVLILLVNIAVAIWGCNTNPTKTDWLTLISGWISGIATLIVGIIAYLQSKNYSLHTIKFEIKNQINNEKQEILNIFNELTQFSKYIKLLNNVVIQKNTMKSELEYKLDLDVLREQILAITTRVQIFNYITDNMEPIVKQLEEILNETYDSYEQIKEHFNNDSKLSVIVNKITKKVMDWIKQLVKIRNNTLKELDDLLTNTENCKSIIEINSLSKNIKDKSENAKSNIKNLIDRMIDQRKEKSEKTNE